ncbi:uncharacterized protein LOC125145484, partial [Tachysurus ichikawai]
PVPAFDSVMVKLNQSAILPCKQNCSDSLRWTVIDELRLNVSECNQTSCWSKEGFNMSHDQYLKGDLSLTINAADYSNRGLYTCQCTGTEIYRVRLIIETVMSPVYLNVGQSLELDLSIPDPVQVTYKNIVSVKLHKSATLSCNWKCPVAAKWINKKHVTVAQCNQTLCWPSNEYVMSQYLST